MGCCGKRNKMKRINGQNKKSIRSNVTRSITDAMKKSGKSMSIRPSKDNVVRTGRDSGSSTMSCPDCGAILSKISKIEDGERVYYFNCVNLSCNFMQSVK